MRNLTLSSLRYLYHTCIYAFVSFIYLYLFNKQTNKWIKWWGLNPEPCAYGANWTTSPVSTFLLLPEAEGKMITFVFSSHSTSSHKLRSALWLWRLWGSGKGPSSHERDRVTHWRSGRVPTGWVLVQPSCEAWKATQCCGKSVNRSVALREK